MNVQAGGRATAALGLLMTVAACATTPARPPLAAVSLPDTASAAAPVQQQIRDRHAQLQAALAHAATPAGELAAAFGELGRLLMAAEYYDTAETCFLNARALAGTDRRWPYLLAHVYRLENDPARAAAAFEAARTLAPDDVPTLIWLAEMELAQSRADRAEPLLLRARGIRGDTAGVRFGLGRVALERRDYRQAAAHLEAALQLAPQATRVHYPLALAYRGLGDQGRAEAHLRLRGDIEVPADDPLLAEVFSLLQNASAYEVRGSRALEERRWDDAVDSLRKAIELAPSNAFSRLNLATAHYMRGEGDAALAQYREAVRLSPDLARAHFGIGAVMEARGGDAEAIAAYREAVRRDPEYVEARFSLANALRRGGRVEEALPHYEEIVRANPGASQASFGYAMGLVRLRRYPEARARLEQAAGAFPDQAGFAHALARLLAAAPDGRVRDGARAVAIMQELLRRERSLAMSETMAMALAETGRFDEAVQWQREALAAATDGKRADLVGRLTANLRLYESRRPCREPWPDDDPVHRPGT